MRLSFQQVLFALGTALGLGAIAFGGYMTWNLLNPPKGISVQPEPGCDLHRGPCGANLPGGAKLSVSVTPRPIPVTQALTLEVELASAKATSVEVDIVSLDMYMGYNHRTLKSADGQRFTGSTVLPVCSRERMRWRLTVIARSGREIYSVPFLFDTETRLPVRS